MAEIRGNQLDFKQMQDFTKKQAAEPERGISGSKWLAFRGTKEVYQVTVVPRNLASLNGGFFLFNPLLKSEYTMVSACFKMIGLCSTQTLKQSWDWCDGSRVPQCVPLMIPRVGEHCLESRGITCFQYLIVLVAIDVDYNPPFTSHPAVIALGVQMKLEIPD